MDGLFLAHGAGVNVVVVVVVESESVSLLTCGADI